MNANRWRIVGIGAAFGATAGAFGGVVGAVAGVLLFASGVYVGVKVWRK